MLSNPKLSGQVPQHSVEGKLSDIGTDAKIMLLIKKMGRSAFFLCCKKSCVPLHCSLADSAGLHNFVIRLRLKLPHWQRKLLDVIRIFGSIRDSHVLQTGQVNHEMRSLCRQIQANKRGDHAHCATISTPYLDCSFQENSPMSLSSASFKNNRRSFLRAAGICIALPILESFKCKQVLASGIENSPKRMVCIGNEFGMYPGAFWPNQTGSEYDLPHLLQPMAPIRQHCTLFRISTMV